MTNEALDRLRALAVKCRKQAETATDPEAAKALRDVAADMEAIACLFEKHQEG